MDWFYTDGGDPVGPLSEEALITKLKSGEIPLTVFVSRQGMERWITSGEFLKGRTPPPLPAELSTLSVPAKTSAILEVEVLPPTSLTSFVPAQLQPTSLPLLLRRLAWGVGIFLALCILIPVGWMCWQAMEKTRQETIARKQAEEENRLRWEQYHREAQNPVMGQRTKAVWQQINTVHDKVADLVRQQTDPTVIYQKRAYMLSQIDADQADPLLVDWIRQSIANSTGFMQLCEAIRQEQQGREQLKAGTEKFFTVLGVVLGALADNGQSVSDNMQMGNLAGQLGGQGAGLIMDSLGDKELDRKYKPWVNSLNSTQMALENQRAEMMEFFSKKYGLAFFQAP